MSVTLAVHYDIQADGSVDVRYEMDREFGSVGRHGIEFDVVTRESWDADRTKNVVYEVSGLTVTTPSGAPEN